MSHFQSKSSHAKQFTILYSITSTFFLQLQRKDSLNMALTFKKDKKYTHFLFMLQLIEVKLSMFQYKIVHNILYTNKILHRMKKKRQPDCPYCHGMSQTPLHLFVECSIAKLVKHMQHVEETLLWSKTKLYIWCFKIHIILANSESLNHNWTIFPLH